MASSGERFSKTSSDDDKDLKDLLSSEVIKRLAFSAKLQEMVTRKKLAKLQTAEEGASVLDLLHSLQVADSMANDSLQKLHQLEADDVNTGDVSFRHKPPEALLEVAEPNKKHDSGYCPSPHVSLNLSSTLTRSSRDSTLMADGSLSLPSPEVVVTPPPSTASSTSAETCKPASEHTETASESASMKGFPETSGPGSLEVEVIGRGRSFPVSQPVENTDTESTSSSNSEDAAADETMCV